MSDRSKKIFLAIAIILPFLVYCVYYYGVMIKNAPYKFTEFDSITLKYGTGDSLVNQYNSKTGKYVYLDNRDSLVVKNVRLNKDDLLYLHRKAVTLGFWDFPEQLSGSATAERHQNIPRYYLEYKYQRKSKKLLFDADFNGDPKLKGAAKLLIDEVQKTLKDAEDRG